MSMEPAIAAPGSTGRSASTEHAWKLYRYIEKKLDAQSPPVETGAPSAPLPEAPCSANCHISLEGRQVQLTLRDSDEARLLERLTTVLRQYPVQAPSSPQVAQGGWCQVHQVAMPETTKNGRTWRSHRTDDGWCKGVRFVHPKLAV